MIDLKKFALPALRIGITLIALVIAAVVGRWLWIHYRVEPWTRDGRVRADIVQIAPDISGLVTEVRVKDNAEVLPGDVLFVIDRPRFELALSQATANLNSVKVQLEQARREDKRSTQLDDLASQETKEQAKSKVDQLGASLAQASAAVDLARLNLARTEVRATVPGLVTNLDLRPGTYATVGHPLLALLDTESLHVVGYFEETKIERIHVGDRVDVRLMGDSRLLTGHVESIAGGIEDRERNASSNLLANVNPTFNWVRLAQRIPVRVTMDPVPAGMRLIMGQTVTVDVKPNSGPVSCAVPANLPRGDRRAAKGS